MTDSDKPRGAVYFILDMEANAVKIGFSMEPEARLRSLQTAHHSELKIVRTVFGTTQDEKRFQKYFAPLRMRGEWFQFSDEMLTFEWEEFDLNETDTIRMLISLSRDLARRIDDYRFANRIPTKAEAIRRLIEKGLEEDPDTLRK